MPKKIILPKYPNAMRQYRRKRHFKLKEIALLINQASAAHLSHWEKGRKLPSLTNALKLSAILKCPVETL